MVALNKITRNIFLVLFGFIVFISNVYAEITASVDRNSIDLNESFVLEIKINTDSDLEPDFSVLDKNFNRGQISLYRNTSINNFAEAVHSQTWAVTLMAKEIGKQVIPAIPIGNENSKPISITINEAHILPPGEAEIFIKSEVDFEEAYVQSQIIYRVKVFRSVATRQEVYTPPVITGADVITESVAENYYKSNLNGRMYNVTEIVKAIYPQTSGEIEIPPANYETRILSNTGISGKKLFKSDTHKVTILPIPPPPASFPDASWLPAMDVQLTQELSHDLNEISVGEPFTRTITVSVLGQIETQIPELSLQDIKGLNIYTDQPKLERYFEAEGIRGVRKEQVAIIAVTGGSIEIPELQLPWWNIKTKEWSVATLPTMGFSLDIKPPEEDISPLPQYTDLEEINQKNNSGYLLNENHWKIVSQLLGILWLFTIFFWWILHRKKRENFLNKKIKEKPTYKRQSRLIKAVKKSAKAGDKAGVRLALMQWAELQWPDKKPRSIAELAKRLKPPLSEELNILSANSYGNSSEDWDNSKIIIALDSLTLVNQQEFIMKENSLPNLMPQK
tara:strand:+ start:301 stop:1989 length:1689 start_codon:yes stop_codon:yes gene_type:complete